MSEGVDVSVIGSVGALSLAKRVALVNVWFTDTSALLSPGGMGAGIWLERV